MKKRKIKANIMGEEYVVTPYKDSNDPEKIKRIAIRELKKINVSIEEILAKHVSLHKCNNCDRLAKYELLYNVNFNENEIELFVTDISYPTYKEYTKLWCGKCLKELNGNSIQRTAILYNVDNDTANKIVLDRNSSCFYRTNFTSEEAYKQSQARNKDWYIKKYGEDGTKKYEDNIKKWWSASNIDSYKKDSMSMTYAIKKTNNLELATDLYKKRLSDVNNSLQSLINKYGIDVGTKKYENKIEKLRYNATLDSYIERYGKINGPIKYNNWKEKCAVTLDNLISKYGESEATMRYKKWLIGITSINQLHYSKESERFFSALSIQFPTLTLLHGKHERFVWDDNNNKIYFYDCYIKEYNMLIEYDTPAYHPNPMYLTEDEMKTKTYKGSYEKDLLKEKLANEQGYDFYRVYVKSKADVCREMNKLIEYIKQKYDS